MSAEDVARTLVSAASRLISTLFGAVREAARASRPRPIRHYRRSGKWDEAKSVHTSLDAAGTSARATVFRRSLGGASKSAWGQSIISLRRAWPTWRTLRTG